MDIGITIQGLLKINFSILKNCACSVYMGSVVPCKKGTIMTRMVETLIITSDGIVGSVSGFIIGMLNISSLGTVATGINSTSPL